MRSDYEAHPAEGQSHGALKRSTQWLPLLSVCGSDLGARAPDNAAAPPGSAVARTTRIEKSGVALLLSVFAWIEIIASPVAGLVVGSEQSVYFGWLIFLTCFVSGLILLGFARVIEHLCESAQSLHRIERALERPISEKDST